MGRTIAMCYSSVNSILPVPLRSALLSNGGAMENKEIRRTKLVALIEEMGSAAAVAERTGIDATYLRNIKNHVRDMGDDIARRIEDKLGKATGWMDTIQAAEAPDTFQLMEDYSKASPEWQLTLRLLAKVPLEQQTEVAATVNKILAGDVPALPAPLYNSKHENRSAVSDKKKNIRK